MAEKPIVNVHIEKTAGRSVREVLTRAFGQDRVLIYRPANDRLIRGSDRVLKAERVPASASTFVGRNAKLYPVDVAARAAIRLLERRKSFPPEELPANFSAISGHFSGNRFEHIIDPESANYTSVLRDPLERMKSHFQHWKDTTGKVPFRVKVPFDKSMTFEQFALLPELQNYQLHALGFDAHRYGTIGVIDHLPEYLEELGLIDMFDEVPRVGVANYGDFEAPSAAFIARFQEFHNLDYELYTQVSAQWD